MGPKDVILKTMNMSESIINKYLDDLSDADLRLVAIEGMHPIALQLGHLILSERRMLEMVEPGVSPELPAGFAEHHDIKNPPKDDTHFTTKDEYLKLWAGQRAATKNALESLSDADLDDTRDGKLPARLPTVSAVFNMAGLHAMNHSGQFVVVRRLLKKPIAM
jgi:DinB superfamily